MSETQKIATVFGGTGFVGRQVVRGLARKGYTIKVATRVPESAFFLRTCGVVGQIVPFAVNYKDVASIARAISGADVVVNCVGILYERRRGDFKRVHAELPAIIASECARAGVKRFVHVSSLGAANGISQYALTKREGEISVLSHFPAATILRPSIIFGEDDNFFNRFARMAQVMPFLPLIAGGKTRFQPVYVGDVANAVRAALFDDPDAAGQIYELGGPEVVTFKDMYERMFRYTGQKRCMMNMSFGIAKMKASLLGLMPNPLLTRDQVDSLRTDVVVNGDKPGLTQLGVTPTSMDVILPAYLESYRPGGKFAH